MPVKLQMIVVVRVSVLTLAVKIGKEGVAELAETKRGHIKISGNSTSGGCYIIYSLVFYTHILLHSGSWGCAGTYPSRHMAKAGYTLDKLSVHHMATLKDNSSHTKTPASNLELPICLTCVFFGMVVGNWKVVRNSKL